MKSIALLLAISLTASCWASEKPNVVIFFSDDQGALDAQCYGSKDLYTPTIDRLAKDGVRFTQAYAHKVCCPARAMLLTGRHPQRSNVTSWTQGNAKGPKGRNMDVDEITLAQILKKAGYATGLFGKWHLGADPENNPTKRGFDEFFGFLGGFIDNYNHHFLHGKGFHDLYDGEEEVFKNGEYFPAMITERAIDYIDRNKADPFFLFMSYNLPHYPEQAESQYDERYKNLPMPRRSFAKVVSTMDGHMAQVMNRLDHHNLTDKTIVIFMADNGFSTEDIKIRVDQHTSGLPKGHNYGANKGGGNAGKWRGHKGTFYEGGLRVPAIISYPAQLPKNEVRDQAITAMDWLPTITALCDVHRSERKLDGFNILPVIKDAKAKSPYKTMHWAWQNGWAVREGPWKLINDPRHGGMQLLNLQDTKPEVRNYLTEKPALVEQLKTLHRQWVSETQ